MFEVTARDGAARLGRWTLASRDVPTPAVAHPAADRHEPPAFAEVVVSRSPPSGAGPGAPDAAWLMDAGSAFVPTVEEGPSGGFDRVPDAMLPAGLAYPPAMSPRAHRAANTFNAEEVDGSAEGEAAPARVALLAPGAPGDAPGAEALMAPGLAPLLDRPRDLADALVGLRDVVFQRVLYLPGVGRPEDLALMAYAGVDLFDAAPCRMAARRGRFLTPEGTLQVLEAGSRPDPDADERLRRADVVTADEARAGCACPACSGDAADDVPAGGDGPDGGGGADSDADDVYPWLLAHNLHAQRAEVGRVRSAVRRGRLRELVEVRVHARPPAVAALRHLDRRHAAFFEERAPVHRDVPLLAPSGESLHRPEVVRYRDRLEERYAPPPSASVLLLLPCSHRKPYAESSTHRRLRRPLEHLANRWAVHEVVVTSPLGVVPRELERAYPAAHYDLPVTGDWGDEEAALIRDGVADLVARGGYTHVLAHLVEAEAALVEEAVPKAEVTCPAGEDPRSDAALERLTDALEAVTDGAEPVDYRARLAEELTCIAGFQFGPEAGRALIDGVATEGRWPNLRLYAPSADGGTAGDDEDDAGDDGDRPDRGDHLATLVGTRGRFTLALGGGRRLLDAAGKDGPHAVRIEDFHPDGDVFAVGVEAAHPGIRVQDDVVCHHAGEVRAVGRAAMCGREMAGSDRGVAVEVKHRG